MSIKIFLLHERYHWRDTDDDGVKKSFGYSSFELCRHVLKQMLEVEPPTTFEIPSYMACEWCCVWKITSYKDGLPFDREDTGFHTQGTVPRGYVLSSISTRLTREKTVTINPWKGVPDA
jgi:hypothetical protein